MLTGLGCASCGGALEAQEGWTNLVCRYCGTSLLVSGDRGIARCMVLDQIDRARAESTLRAWMGRGVAKAPRLAKMARVDEAFLAWFPFVRARFDVIGWVLGTTLRTKNKKSIEVPREIQVERTIEMTRPAADMAEFGVAQVDLQGDRVLPLDEEFLRSRGMVFRPQLEPEEVARWSFNQGMQEVRMGALLHRETFSWMRIVRPRVTLVCYPLWVFRYTFRDRGYQALVDAGDASIAYAQAPANSFVRALKLVAAIGGACYVATTILQSGACVSSDDFSGPLLALLAGFGLVVLWGYRQFRYGSVIEEGSGLISRIDSFKNAFAHAQSLKR